jgi:hypothetical protein
MNLKPRHRRMGQHDLMICGRGYRHFGGRIDARQIDGRSEGRYAAGRCLYLDKVLGVVAPAAKYCGSVDLNFLRACSDTAQQKAPLRVARG